jgi:hypothetical protein
MTFVIGKGEKRRERCGNLMGSQKKTLKGSSTLPNDPSLHNSSTRDLPTPEKEK